VKILDTDHCVAVLRGKLDLRLHVQPDEPLAITTISIAELTYGAHKSAHSQDNLARLDAFLAGLDWLPFDSGSARCYGYLRAGLEKEGQVISDLDLQIARMLFIGSIAIQEDAPLLTHNRQHFERLVKAGGLNLEDWLA
jgi:tRNA(fMet)-specific endonuclease VapC